jgi:competence protein ComEC
MVFQKTFKFSLGYLALSIVFLFSEWWQKGFSDQPRLVMCDVGQGDALLIITSQARQILVDTGPDLAVLECLGEQMLPWDRKVDFIFISHRHSDHTTGLIEIMKRYENSLILLNKSSQTLINSIITTHTSGLERSGLSKNINILEQEDHFSIDGIETQVIWPPAHYHSEDENDNSLVLYLKYGTFSILLTGDATKTVWNRLNILGYPLPQAVVLKVPHHGSSNCCSRSFVETVNPKLSLISAGENNRFGHPHPETLKLFKEMGVAVRRTDQEGTIVVPMERSGLSTP